MERSRAPVRRRRRRAVQGGRRFAFPHGDYLGLALDFLGTNHVVQLMATNNAMEPMPNTAASAHMTSSSHFVLGLIGLPAASGQRRKGIGGLTNYMARTRSSRRRLGGLSRRLARALLASSAAACPATHSVSSHHEEARKHHRYHDEGEDPPETGPGKPSACKHTG